MNLKAFASCGVILLAWSIVLGEMLQKTTLIDYTTELFALTVLVICWVCWIITPLNLGNWKTNFGD
jgi:CBS domain containing-hemolysin-like protein